MWGYWAYILSTEEGVKCLIGLSIIKFRRPLIQIIQQYQMMKKNDTFSVSVLIQQFNSEAPDEKKVNFINNLKLISSVLGYDRVRAELVSFVINEVLEDDDRIIINFLDKIFLITEAFGGPLHNLILLPIFEVAIQLESSTVRDKACNKLEEAVTYLDIKKNQDALMKFIKKIDQIQFVETRQALARLIVVVLGFFNKNNQAQLLNIYTKMASHESIVARKYAAKYSKNLIKYLSVNQSLILKIVEILFKDKQQSNKIFLIDTLIQLSKYKSKQFLQPYFNLISYQFTWRIRYQLISKVGLLAAAMDKNNFKLIFLPFYSKYLSDIEPQIRSIACLQLKTVCEAIEAQDIVSKIFPNIKNIAEDSCLYVRNAFAKSILTICPIVGKKHTSQHILPKFLQLLKDQSHQVRISIFQNVQFISKTLGIQTLSQTTIPALFQLATDKNWRVRAQSLDIFLYFCKGLGTEFMNQKNTKLLIQLLKDSVFSVRKKTIEAFPKLIQIFGNQWFQTNLMPKIFLLQKAQGYLQRQTLLFTIQQIVPLLTPQYINKFIVPSLFSMAGDQVANIRYNVCKCIGHVLPYVNPQIYRQLIKNLKEDKDIDVKTIASKIETQYKH